MQSSWRYAINDRKMKKTKVFGFTLIVLLILTAGVFIGYFIGLFNAYGDRVKMSKRQEDLQIRTESYQPSCDDLKKVEERRIVKSGNDTFVIEVSENYFVVFGLNAEPGKVPVTAWWGASREEALKQACGKK